MCGIAGIVNFKKQPQNSEVSKMINQISHRGPDQKGIYVDRNVGLGIQRLSIIDLKSGDQPIHNEDKAITVVFNGEIYNFLELKDLLEKKGHTFKTKSDTEVLVHLYESFGTDMSKLLRGMFAFAIWDRNKDLILISRDHVGIKPLYFWRDGKVMFFGSELKSILAAPLIRKEINIEAFKAYTQLGYIPGNLSIFKNIHKLLPGHSLIFSKDGLKIDKFYEMIPSKKALTKSIDNYLEDSVISHSISDVPLGVLLSGGIDSSLVTYYLTKNIRNRINTFSINFKEKSFDESKFANIVSKRLNTKHHQESFSSKDVINLFPTISQKLDEPLADPSLFPTFKVCALARKYVKVVLSGDGGDELFGGYPTYSGHLLAKQVKRIFPKNLSNLAIKILNLFPTVFENYPKTEVGKEFIKGLHLTPFKRHLLWMSLKNYNSNLLNKDLFGTYKKVDTDLFKALQKNIEEKHNNLVTQMQLFDFETYLKDDLLVKVDRASMYNSLEVRVPFLNVELIEKAFSTDSQVGFFNTKKILRDLIKEKFPPEIFRRGKKGFGIPLSKWIAGDLEDLVNDHLENKKLYDYFNRRVVEKLWDDHKKRKQDNSKLIWMVMIFSGFLNEWL